jgi:hypothetical protein
VNFCRTSFDFSKAALQVIYVFEAPGHALAETAAAAVHAVTLPRTDPSAALGLVVEVRAQEP